MYKNMRDIIILNCLEIPCSNLFKYVYTDIGSTFQEMGYKFKIIDNITHIYDNSIIFLSWASQTQLLDSACWTWTNGQRWSPSQLRQFWVSYMTPTSLQSESPNPTDLSSTI